MPTLFGNDRVLLFNVQPWKELGFGVPNFGDNIGTRSLPIGNLVDEIGKGQLYIMTHVDAQRTQPPSVNTVTRICKVYNRVSSVLGGRQVPDGQPRLEEGHYTAAANPFLIHPVPYFGSSIVRNNWMVEYNNLVMIALTNMMQHSDNNLALTITAKFAQDVFQYFTAIKILIGSELLGIPAATLKDPAFVFNQAQFDAYAPSGLVLNVEPLDSPGQVFSTLTEDDLTPLYQGIPANLIAPNLVQYPIGPLPDSSGLQGQNIPGSAALVGQNQIAPAGGTVGQPMQSSPSGAATQQAVSGADAGSASAVANVIMPPPL